MKKDICSILNVRYRTFEIEQKITQIKIKQKVWKQCHFVLELIIIFTIMDQLPKIMPNIKRKILLK
ncbi:MAG: hypothetical protein ACFFCE_09420 [Promethearchaeota archaeon]